MGNLLRKPAVNEMKTEVNEKDTEVEEMKTAVKERRWKDVETLLRDSNYDIKAIDEFIISCETFNRFDVSDDIFAHFNSHQVNRLITAAVKKEEWASACRLLKFCEDRGVHIWVIAEIGNESSKYTLSLCGNDAQITYFVTWENWESVGDVLKLYTCKNDTQLRWVVEEASKKAEDWDFIEHILPYCSDDQLESVLERMVERCMWRSVGNVLERGVSDEKCRWAVEEACKKAGDPDFKQHILPHCSGHRLESVLKYLVTQGRWNYVGKLLEGCVSNTQRRWAVEEGSKKADDPDFACRMVSHCSEYQLESVLEHLVNRGMWMSVGKVLERGVSDKKSRWAVEEACKRVDDWDFVKHILPHCIDDQLKSVLKHLVTQKMWMSVGKVLERGVSDKQCRWAIEEACKRAGDRNFVKHIMPYCSDHQLESLLERMVKRDMWISVGKVLERGVSDEQRRWAFVESSKKAGVFRIVPCRWEEQRESVLEHLVTQNMWMFVGKVLERGVSDEQRRWAVEEASKKAKDWTFLKHILLYCSDDQLESVLEHLVKRGMWMSVAKVLERGVSDEKRRWAVEKACKRADDWSFVDHILPYCSDDQFESVLERMVKRALWMSVGKVLERDVSDEKRRWAVQEASKKAYDYTFEHCSLVGRNEVLRQSVLEHLVTQNMWIAVGKVLERGASDKQRKWAVEEASKKAEDWNFEKYILPYCSEDQLESLLERMVNRGMWMSVGKVLERGVSDEQRRWAVEEGCKRGDDTDFACRIVPHCSEDQLESVLEHLVKRGMWMSVGKVLKRGDSDEKRRWAEEEGSKRVDFACRILSHCSEDQLGSVLEHLVKVCMWKSVGKMLERGVSDEQCRWAVEEASKKADDPDFVKYILPHCSDDQLESVLEHLVTQNMCMSVGKVLERGVIDEQSRWAVKEASKNADDWIFVQYMLSHCSDDQLGSLLEHLVKRHMWMSVGKVLERGVSDAQLLWAVKEASRETKDHDFLHHILPYCSDENLTSVIPHLVHRKLDKSLYGLTEKGEKLHILVLSEMCRVFTYYNVMKQIEKLGQPSKQLLNRCLSPDQLNHDLKNVVLRLALHQNKWGVIRNVSLSHVWEQVRRELFRAAVEQKRWSLVKKWADHTVYDNQRWWAQEEAYKDKQWEVMLLLTEYGMTDIELMRVRYRLAKYADWGVVVKMIERGVDVTEVREVVESTMISRKTARDAAKRRAMEVRWCELRKLEDHYTVASTGRVRKWSLVLFYLHRHPTRLSLQRLLQRAIEDKAWHVVRNLLKLGLDTSLRDSLLTEMISRHQWCVCRVLLEQGISLTSCEKALPLFMESDQWTLVARVMEFNVGDECRQRVMRRAFERREGSVVWRCISTMQHYRLSVEEREEMFQKAMSGGVWDAVKPLMETEDTTGLQHRDTALLVAIDHHQWDVVDYCQWYRADINMKDDDGQTPLNRAGLCHDWKAVKELVIRGGDPNVPDKYKQCILNIVILNKQWDLVRLIIEYHGNIHLKDHCGSTPLDFLIGKRQGEIIHHTLMWCPDQSKVVNKRRETTLHAIALDKRPELLYSQILRGVNPLSQTTYGQSVLQYAVMNPHCAQRMVAECIKLGLGTHQSQLNGHLTMEVLCNDIFHYILGRRLEDKLTSPLMPLAVVSGQHVVAHMLYESGSCSYTQLLQWYTQLRYMSDPLSNGGTHLSERFSKISLPWHADKRAVYEKVMDNIITFMPYLREMATTPRSLVSTCRLVISHCLVVRGKRERDVQQLPLTDKMKNFVLFSDLADPDYAWYLHGSLPPLTSESDSESDSELDSESDSESDSDSLLFL